MASSKVQNSHTRSALDLEIKNFGPIVSGKISVKPMTVLIGPNNSGKSYAALMIHSVLSSSMRPLAFPPNIIKPVERLLSSKERPLVLEPQLASKIAKHLASEIVDGIYVRIGILFSDNFGFLARIGSRKCTLKIRTEYFSANLDLSSKQHKILLPDFRIKFESTASLAMPETTTTPRTMIAPAPHPYYSSRRPRTLPGRHIFVALSSIRHQMHPLRSFYLPASRSGILQGHKALSASIVRNAPYVGLRDTKVLKLSGVVSDFVGDMLEVSERPFRKPPFYDVAYAMEEKILHGRIKLTRSLLPEIKFSYRNSDFPLELASSAVSEMAPLVLYLKHVIAEPDLLIIEEPEAHLHPRNQTELVKFLAQLVRRGMKVLITTHSPFIVEKLSNLIQNSALHANAETPADEEPSLMPADVSAYSFEPASSSDPESYEYKIRELDVSAESGLQSDEFVKVTAGLYNDYVEIQDSIEGELQRR